MRAKSQLCKLKRKIASFILKPLSESGDAERLARCTSDEEVDVAPVVVPLDLGEVPEVRDLGEPLLQDGGGELVDPMN